MRERDETRRSIEGVLRLWQKYSSPAFRVAKPVAWYSGTDVLRSGWAWGQELLDGAAAVAESSYGEGKVFVFGAEVTFRAQAHGTFKLLFNALYYGSAKELVLERADITA